MSAKQYFKSVGMAIVEPIYKSLVKSYPNYAPGMPMVLGKTFRWSLNSRTAYNNKIFYSAQNILVGKLIEAPIMFSKKKSGSKVKFERFYSKAITNEKRFAIKQLALIELENHPLNDLFDSPNDYQVGMELMEDFWHNVGFGDGYIWFETLGEGSRNSRPVGLHSLTRERVDIVEDSTKMDGIGSYTYTTIGGIEIKIPKENILHLKNWNPNVGDLKGLGVDQLAAMDISLNTANNAMQGAAFANGGRGTTFSSDITTDKDGEVVEKMTGEQMDKLKESVKRDFEGIDNYRKIHYTNGKLEVQSFGDTLIETDAVNAEDSQWKNIYTICGVPWALSPAATSVSENSIIVSSKWLVSNKVVGMLRKFDQKCTQKAEYFYKDGTIATHDLTEFPELAPDLKLMKEVYGSPILDGDETRAIFGYDDMRDGLGKHYLVPTGLMKLEDIVNDEFSGAGNQDDNLNF